MHGQNHIKYSGISEGTEPKFGLLRTHIQNILLAANKQQCCCCSRQ